MDKIKIESAAICGLFCGTCDLYPQDCEGCLSSKVNGECRFCAAGFRTCAKNHNITRCFECAEFPCKRLNEFSKQHYQNGICHHKNIIKDLYEMKENGLENWVNNQAIKNTCNSCGKLIKWHQTTCNCNTKTKK